MPFSYKYDASINVGDIVTGYMTGFWVVERIEFRTANTMGNDTNPLHHCKKVLQPTGDKSKRLSGCWDAAYSYKITKEVVAQMKETEQKALDKRFAALEALV